MLGFGRGADEFDHGDLRIAKRSPPDSTISAETMASVSGILMVKVVPLSGTVVRSTVPPIWSMLVLTTSMPTPRRGHAGDLGGGGEARREDELADLRIGQALGVGLAHEAVVDRLLLDALDVEAFAVVGDLDDDVAALMIGGEPDRSGLGLALAHTVGVVGSSPWSAELRTMWVRGP